MPTPPSDEPLQKITINIYAKDYADLKRLEGHGWSTAIREIVRQHLNRRRNAGTRAVLAAADMLDRNE